MNIFNKKNIIHFWGIVLMIAGGQWTEARAQAVATLEADTIALGDQTVLSIRNALNFPSTEMLTTDGIVALSQTFDTSSRTQHTVITSFEPGAHFIRLSPTDSLLLIVNDVAIDTTKMEPRDIMPLEKIPYSFWEIFRWVLLFIVLGAIAIAIWWIVTHRKVVKKMLGISEPIDTRTPKERAIEQLEQLRRMQLWQNGKAKEYHTELTDIVRRFIEESTEIRATEMTSYETIEEVENRKWGVDISLLNDIFTRADLVKFAKNEPLANEHELSMTEATRFIEELWQYVKPEDKEVTNA